MKLTTLVNQYIIYRKSLGDKYRVNEWHLMRFCRSMGKNIDVLHASRTKIHKFLYGNGKITGSWFIRYATLSCFYKYAMSRGYINHSPLPTILPKRPHLFVPYIYTRQELRCIFKAALIYRDIKKNYGYIQPYMIRILLVLLYGMGLRIGEALSLTMIDVNIIQSTITIREAKFNKCRIIPFGKQLANVLSDYIVWRKKHRLPRSANSPFLMAKGLHLKTETVRGIFHRILKIANLKPADKTKHQPRLHDLRHTFAVHRLTSWYKNNANVQILLPILSVYLGHTCLAAISVYLTMTTDLLREAGIRFEQYAMGGVI
jgi:site-specific recombinase XerD